MATSKTQKSRKTGTAGKNTKGRTSSQKKKQSSGEGFASEILLLVVLALCALMMIGNLGMGGDAGKVMSSVLFGVMGLMAYVFPVFLFFAAAFIISNRRSSLARKKLIAAVVFFIFLCGLLQLITEGYTKSNTLKDYYVLSSDYLTGGGVLGGAVVISTTAAFGTVGAYIIIGVVLLICLILITQRSFFGFCEKVWDGIVGLVQGGRDRYLEGQPERDLKKEVRKKEKQKQREERRRALEEELEELDSEEEESPPKKKKSKDSKESREREFETPPVLTVPEEEPVPEPDKKTEKKKSSGRKKKKEEPEIPPEPEEDSLLEEDLDALIMRARPAQEEVIEEEGTSPVRKTSRSKKSEPASDPEEIRAEIEEQPAPKEYQFPPLSLLRKGSGRSQGDSDEYLRSTAQKLHDTLHNFGVNVTITNISCGPTVTRYELQPEMGVKVSRIVSLSDDIKLNLAAPDIRIEAPIPGKAAVGIEVPNRENSPVMLRDLLQSREFTEAQSSLSFAVGKDIGGKPVVADIGKMPHLLIAGATGSGKSVCINTLVISLLYKSTPDQVKLIMVDPKVVELSVYNGIPHLLIPVVTDPKKAAGALNWAVAEMTTRYNTFAEYRVRNLEEYNKKIEGMKVPEGETPPEKMPRIVIIVDELADLMMVAPGEVEDAICRLAQLARAAGIHLIIATQRPSVNVITGLIKANMPSRIAFSVSSGVDSRTILDMNGAEKLLGKGDMLFYPQGYQKPARLQGAFVSDEEVSSIVEFLKEENPVNTGSEEVQQQVNAAGMMSLSQGGEERDSYFQEAGKFIIEKDKASIGMLQRMFKIGFNRAARIMDQLADAGVVGPEEGTKPRKVLMSQEEFEAYIEESL